MSYLLEPLAVGTLALKNRLVMPPMATSKAAPDDSVSQALIDYYAEKSRGGHIGLVITEHCFIAKQGQNRAGQPSVADDSKVDGLARLADVIHANGSKAVMQISHAGGAASAAVTGFDVVAPSNIPSPVGPGEIPRPLTAEEIRDIVIRFAEAAVRVQRAGFDGVELHCAHGYLLDQFFSPMTNKRTDEYGGDVHGRIRLTLEVVSAVREAVGSGFPLLVRLGAADYVEGGNTIADAEVAAVALEAAGVDMLDITGGVTGYIRPGHDEPGYFAELSGAVKRVTTIPVILTGGITEPEHAEALLASGSADLIGVGRAILKDSDWARHAIAWAQTTR